MLDQPREQLAHRGLVQRRQGDERAAAAGAQSRSPVGQLRTGEADDEQRQVADPVDEVLDEVEQPLVGVVQVLDEQQDRTPPGEGLEEPAPAGEQLALGEVGGVAGQAEQPGEPDAHERAVGVVLEEVAQRLAELVLDQVEVVVVGDAEPGPDDLRERPVRRVLTEARAPAAVPEHGLGQPVDVLLELPADPRLPDPGRSRHQDQARSAFALGGVQHVLDQSELHGPPHERSLQAVGALGPADARDDLGGAPERLRRGLALELHVAVQLELDARRGQPAGRAVDEHGSGRGRGLHACRGVHGVARDHRLPVDGGRGGDGARDDAGARGETGRRRSWHRGRPRPRPGRARRGPRARRRPRPRPGCPTPPSPRRR